MVTEVEPPLMCLWHALQATHSLLDPSSRLGQSQVEMRNLMRASAE